MSLFVITAVSILFLFNCYQYVYANLICQSSAPFFRFCEDKTSVVLDIPANQPDKMRIVRTNSSFFFTGDFFSAAAGYRRHTWLPL